MDRQEVELGEYIMQDGRAEKQGKAELCRSQC